MNVLAKVISSTLENAYRIVKVLRFGKSDVQTADEAAPYGIDSNPIKDMEAVFSDTSADDQKVIIGYLNRNQLARPGELRTYSTDQDGNEKFYTWAKIDGTYEVGGDQDNLVRYSKLAEAFNALKQDFNNLVSAFNTHTHILTLTSGTGTAAPVVTPEQPSTADISGAKIEEIKTL